jgi:hypothetical protein
MLNRENKIYIFGKEYKHRPIDLIFKKILELRKLRTEFFKTKWKLWYDDCNKVKTFWGKFKKNKRLSGPGFIFEFSEHGHSYNSVEGDFNAQVRIADDNKIALLIHDPVWKQHALATIEDRLLGKTKQIIRRQDLVSRYEVLSLRDRHRATTFSPDDEIHNMVMDWLKAHKYLNVLNTRKEIFNLEQSRSWLRGVL